MYYYNNDLKKAYAYTLPRAKNPQRTHHEEAKTRLPKIIEMLKNHAIPIPNCVRLVELFQNLKIVSSYYFPYFGGDILRLSIVLENHRHPLDQLCTDNAINLLINIRKELNQDIFNIEAQRALPNVNDFIEECNYFLELAEVLRHGQSEYDFHFNTISRQQVDVDANQKLKIDLQQKIGFASEVDLWRECRTEISLDYINEEIGDRVQIYTDGSFNKKGEIKQLVRFIAPTIILVYLASQINGF